VLQPLPEHGRPFQEILLQLFHRVFPIALNTTSPGYLAYIPGGGLPDSALADLMSLVTNRYPGLWSAAPVVASIELAVIRWFCDLVGFGQAGGGFFTSGGSLANWSALVAARELRMPDDFRLGVVYTSNQAHHSVDKAAILAGLPRSNLRRVPVDQQQQVRVDRLLEMLREDRKLGRLPLAIVAHAGTTNTGAVDDLRALADLAAQERIWLHVDAAYGGFFLLTDRGKQVLRGIEHADSVTLDPHKGLFLPYGTGCLLVRQRQELRRVFAVRGEYMAPTAPGDGFVDFCDISPELTRDFRGLRVWLPLQMHGTEPFRRCLDEKLDLAQLAASELARIDGIKLVAPPKLSIVAFRLNRPEWSHAEADERNRQLLTRINASQRVLLTPTILDGRFVIRLCILSFRTHRDRIEECLDLIREAVAAQRH
jgi:aromatic-L-amino-acid decarboxylase